VFEYLIDSFKTYKPMLASIKNEYELMLAQQRDEIQRLLPLQVADLVVIVPEKNNTLSSYTVYYFVNCQWNVIYVLLAYSMENLR